jgi:hypothetical protein
MDLDDGEVLGDAEDDPAGNALRIWRKSAGKR